MESLYWGRVIVYNRNQNQKKKLEIYMSHIGFIIIDGIPDIFRYNQCLNRTFNSKFIVCIIKSLIKPVSYL